MAIVSTGTVLFAKNSDRDPNEAQVLEWHPRHDHPSGAKLCCTWIEIPQLTRTNAILISRPFWMWGAEMGANEHGVVIGNEAVFTREPYAKTGLTGMDLLRLALERSRDAQSAIDVIVALLEAHGQGGGCGHEHRGFTYHNSFLVADPTRAIVLETAGRYWATEEVRGARSISNVLTIPGFAEKHSDRVKTWAAGGRLRRARTHCLLQSARAPADLATILRDHGDGQNAPRYSTVNGGLNGPCVHAGGLLAASQTTASWIAELSPQKCRHWTTGTAAPCCSIFRPVRVAEPMDIGPCPTDVDDGRSLWWRGERIHRRIVANPAHFLPQFAAERDPFERESFESTVSPGEAFRRADELMDRWVEQLSYPDSGNGTADQRPLYVRRYWRKRNRRSGLDFVSRGVTPAERIGIDSRSA